MRSVYTIKENCCGCAACARLCPAQAIVMRPDSEGFLYPQIDQDACIDCQECVQACPFQTEGHYKNTQEPHYFAARHNSPDVLRASTSGGAFTAISDEILRRGGVIYGVIFDDSLRVIHARASTREDRDEMRVSKYVQTSLVDIYPQIARDLADGRTVLFTGTPCQNAAIRACFGTSGKAENLILCDLICHSIPSPRIWEDYKKMLEAETGGKLNHLQFRSKIHDWTRTNSNRGFLFTTEHSNEIHEDNRFYDLFFKAGTITRPSCSQCPYTDERRTGDLTIADYWGIEKYSDSWYDPLGVSLILVNTPKGRTILEGCRCDLKIEERPSLESLNEQKRLHEPTVLPTCRSTFWTDYDRNGFMYVMEKYLAGLPDD